MVDCPVCALKFDYGDYLGLADHFVSESSESDALHVSWLNRNLTKERLSVNQLSRHLSDYYSLGSSGIKSWIIHNFVTKFRGSNPHPFIIAMQNYDEDLLKGYVIEHHHFLLQWIKSCAYIIAKSDFEDVHNYELDNIITELHGYGQNIPSHHELLLRMGESLGLKRSDMLRMEPLSKTRKAILTWKQIAEERSWIEVMAAMHSLELIANRDLNRFGATLPYFDPDILTSPKVKKEVKDFLKEGYEADIGHSYTALDIVEKYASKENIEDIQGAYLISANAFYDYLEARIERGLMIENKQ